MPTGHLNSMEDEFTEDELDSEFAEEDDESSVDDDEITPEEDGFLRGYEEAEDHFEESAEE